MNYIKHINFSTVRIWVACLLFFFGLMGMGGTLIAQEVTEDAQVEVVADPVSDTTAITEEGEVADAAAVSEEEVVAAVAPAAAPAAASSASAVVLDEGLNIPSESWRNFFYGLLLVLLAAVVCGIVGKVWDLAQLTGKMNGRYNPLANNNFQATLFLISLPLFLYGVYWSFANHGAMAWREAATEHGQRIDTMFIITTIICVIVLILIHILLFSFAYIYRMRLKKKAYFYPHNNTIELVWTVVPAVVLTILVLFGFFTWRSITNVPEELQKSAIQIEVLGEQFAWTVRYPGRDGEFGPRDYRLTTPLNPYGIDFNNTASFDDVLGGEIVIPVNQSVRFHILSKDILHSFYIPDFRVQVNAVPGMTTYFQFTPTITTQEMRDKMDDQSYDFVMLCNKICGTSHFNMQKRVRVVSEEEYQEWLNQQTFFYTEDVQKEFAERNEKAEASLLDGERTALNVL